MASFYPCRTCRATYMFISVVIATKNRANDLKRTLTSLFTPANLARLDWEVLVIDNGSTDRTNQVCLDFRNTFTTHFRFLIENKPGKSNALNTGFQAVSGDVIAFLDDDVICRTDYLDGIRMVYQGGGKNAAQGRVFVDYHGKRPAWFDEDEYFDQMMLLTDMGDERCELKRSLWGVNMVVPASAIEKAGGFCPELGAGATICFGEDAEFDHRLRKVGVRVIYAPEIVVRHQVSLERLSVLYVFTRSFKIGLCSAHYSPGPTVSLPRFSLYATKELVFILPSVALDLCRSRWGMAIRKVCCELERIGFVWQHWRFRLYGTPSLTIPAVKFLGLSQGPVGTED
jgi:glycosyltransferase involved in cell wall biosynthesis